MARNYFLVPMILTYLLGGYKSQGQELFLQGQPIKDHILIQRSRLGIFQNNSLQCRTEDSTADTQFQQGWYYPNGTYITVIANGMDNVSAIFATRGERLYHLHYNQNSVEHAQDGIYQCVTWTAGNVKTRSIGLYGVSRPTLQRKDRIKFTLISVNPPIFNLTIETINLPATTVAWRRDDDELSYTDQTYISIKTVKNPTQAEYDSTLRVNGIRPGLYTIQVGVDENIESCGNIHLSETAISSIKVKGVEKPVLFYAEQRNLTKIRITWSNSNPNGQALAGYQIFIANLNKTSIEPASYTISQDKREFTIENLFAENTYNVSMVALSRQLPSEVVGPISVYLKAEEKMAFTKLEIILICLLVVISIIFIIILVFLVLICSCRTCECCPYYNTGKHRDFKK